MLRKRPTISSAASDEVWLLKSRVRRIEKPRLGRPPERRGKFIFKPPLWFTSFYYLLGERQPVVLDLEAAGFGGLEVDHQLELVDDWTGRSCGVAPRSMRST